MAKLTYHLTDISDRIFSDRKNAETLVLREFRVNQKMSYSDVAAVAASSLDGNRL